MSLHLIEKFTRVSADSPSSTIVTIDDPTVWSRPWTLMVPLKNTGEEMFEFACHEGNYGLAAILSGARAPEHQKKTPPPPPPPPPPKKKKKKK